MSRATVNQIEDEIILSGPRIAVMYVEKLIKGRWKKGENLIFTTDSTGSKYIDILERLGELDDEIFEGRPHFAYYYAEKYGKKISSKLEDIIATNGMYSFRYADRVLNSRFIKGEDSISQDSYYSMNYARSVIRGRWEKGEKAISENAQLSYDYAKDILKKRFPEGELAISKDPSFLRRYTKFLQELAEKEENRGTAVMDFARDIEELEREERRKSQWLNYLEGIKDPLVGNSKQLMRGTDGSEALNYDTLDSLKGYLTIFNKPRKGKTRG